MIKGEQSLALPDLFINRPKFFSSLCELSFVCPKCLPSSFFGNHVFLNVMIAARIFSLFDTQHVATCTQWCYMRTTSASLSCKPQEATSTLAHHFISSILAQCPAQSINMLINKLNDVLSYWKPWSKFQNKWSTHFNCPLYPASVETTFSKKYKV